MYENVIVEDFRESWFLRDDSQNRECMFKWEYLQKSESPL